MPAIHRCILVMFCVLVPKALVRADDSTVKWITNLDEAKHIAAEEKKDILVNFTGLTWCHYCKLLERDVYSRPEFAPAAKDFVLVRLDYSPADDQLAPGIQSAFQKWRETYRIRTFPTAVVTDASGKPYAYSTGYTPGITPAKFLDKLTTFREAKQQRDAAIATAKNATGVDRAEKLDSALNTIAPLLGTSGAWHEDRLIVLYRDVVDEIRRLDADNAAGLRKTYDERIARNERDSIVVSKQLERFKIKVDSAAALAYIAEVLPGINDEQLRERLERARIAHLAGAGRYEDGLKNVRRLLDSPMRDSKARSNLFYQEAMFLIRLGRTDEAVKIYDQRITDAADDPAQRLNLLRSKAQVLTVFHGDPVQTIAACRQFRAATEPHSNLWERATRQLGQALTRAEKHREALAVEQELLKHNEARSINSAALLLQIAENQHGAGLIDAARKSLDQAAQEINAMKSSRTQRPRKALIDFCEKQLAELRASVGSGD